MIKSLIYIFGGIAGVAGIFLYLPRFFNSIDAVRLKTFAGRFGVLKQLEILLPLLDLKNKPGLPDA